MGLRSYDKLLARAEAREVLYDQDRKAWQAELKVRDAERAADAQRVEELIGQIAARAVKPLPPVIQTALKPDASLPEIGFGLDLAFKGSPGFEGPVTLAGSYVQLSGPQAQTVTQSKVDLDRAKLDLNDEKTIANLQNGTISSLSKDLDQCKDLNTQSDKVIADYKKAAKRSKWQKIWDGAQKVILFGAGAYLGSKL